MLGGLNMIFVHLFQSGAFNLFHPCCLDLIILDRLCLLANKLWSNVSFTSCAMIVVHIYTNIQYLVLMIRWFGDAWFIGAMLTIWYGWVQLKWILRQKSSVGFHSHVYQNQSHAIDNFVHHCIQLCELAIMIVMWPE